MSNPALRSYTHNEFTNKATTKQLVIPGSTVVGDDIYFRYVGADPIVTDPAGYAIVEDDLVGGVRHRLYRKTAVSADITGTKAVVVAAPDVARCALDLVVVSGPSSSNPVAVAAKQAETTSQSSHVSAAPTNPSGGAGGLVLQFCASKDGATASTTRTTPSGYTSPNPNGEQVGSATSFPYVSVFAYKANQAAGTVAAVTWAFDAPTAMVSMFTVVVQPASTVAAIVPIADDTVPAGAAFTGGSTLAGVLGDSDPNTKVTIPLSGSSNPGGFKLGSTGGGPMPGPLQHFDLDLQCSVATATIGVTVKLYQGASLIATYGPFTTVKTDGVETFSQDINTTVQGLQTNLADVHVVIDQTGS